MGAIDRGGAIVQGGNCQGGYCPGAIVQGAIVRAAIVLDPVCHGGKNMCLTFCYQNPTALNLI